MHCNARSWVPSGCCRLLPPARPACQNVCALRIPPPSACACGAAVLLTACRLLPAVIARRYAGRKVMLGVDRLDMIKGIPQKLLAFEKFLEEHPQWRDKASARSGRAGPGPGRDGGQEAVVGVGGEWVVRGLCAGAHMKRGGQPASGYAVLSASAQQQGRLLGACGWAACAAARLRCAGSRLLLPVAPAPARPLAGAAGPDSRALAHRRARVPTPAEHGARDCGAHQRAVW